MSKAILSRGNSIANNKFRVATQICSLIDRLPISLINLMKMFLNLCTIRQCSIYFTLNYIFMEKTYFKGRLHIWTFSLQSKMAHSKQSYMTIRVLSMPVVITVISPLDTSYCAILFTGKDTNMDFYARNLVVF